MISIDTNVLLAAVETAHGTHAPARAFVHSLSRRDDVGVSEFCLVELYTLLRNPKVCRQPLSASEAARVCQSFRRHPRWRLFGFPSDSVNLHNALWIRVAEAPFARRRIFDLRLALALLQQGVTDFATANVKDFEGLGFERVFNPLR